MNQPVSAPPQTLTVEQYEKLRPTMFIEVEGKKVYFGTPNTFAAWRVKSLPTKEPVTLDWIGRMTADEVLFDVGANVGMYSVMAAACRNVRVFAFEPESQNFALLNNNIAINKLSERVVAFPVALLDKPKLDLLYLSEFQIASSCHSFGEEVGFDLKPRGSAFRQGSISVTIDGIVADGIAPLPNHIKIDVDGFEHLVVDGAKETLARPELKSLLIELNTNLAEHHQVFDVLADFGFEFESRQMEGSIRKQGDFAGVGEVVFRRTNRSKVAIAPVLAAETAAESRGPGVKTSFVRRLSLHLPRGEGTAVLDHVLQRMEAAPIHSEPFPHMVIDGVFPEPYYRRMLENFPAEDSFVPIDEEGRVFKGTYKERSIVQFDPGSLLRVPSPQREFWDEFGSWLYSDLFVAAWVKKFSGVLDYRFRRICADGAPLQVRSDAHLVRDHTNYSIAPHTDAPHRLISFLFYMPEDDKLRAYGTSFYRPKDKDFVCWGDQHHTFEPFVRTGTAEFLPNRLVVFPKTERSFHGVEEIKEPGIKRNLVINNIRVLNPVTH